MPPESAPHEIWHGPWVPPGGVPIFSQFSGYGGVFDAAKQIGMPVSPLSYSSEVKFWPQMVEAVRHPYVTQLGNIQNIHEGMFRTQPLISVAGWPCQDNSKAGCNQLGPQGERSGLIRESLRLNDILKPQYRIYENVPMRSQHEGWYNNAIGAEPTTLDARAVSPTNRERLFWGQGFNITPLQGQGPLPADVLQPGLHYVPLTDKQMAYHIRNDWRPYAKHTAKLWSEDNPYLYTAAASGKKGNPHNTFQFEPGGPLYMLTPEGLEMAHGLSEGHTEIHAKPPWRKGNVGTPSGVRKEMIGNGFSIPVMGHILNDVGTDMKARWEAANGPWDAQKHQWSQRNGLWVKDQPVEIAAPQQPKGKGPVAPPASPSYLYHGTSKENAYSIATEGLNTFRPNYGTPDQDMWPDGGVERRSYWTPNQKTTEYFFPEGSPVVLRTDRNANPSLFQNERGSGDVFSRKRLPAKALEILHNGEWVPITRWANPPAEPSTAPRGLGPGRKGQQGYTPAETPLAVTSLMGNTALMAASAYYDAINQGANHQKAMQAAKQAGGVGLGFAGLQAIAPKVAGPLAGGFMGYQAANEAAQELTGNSQVNPWIPRAGAALGTAAMFHPVGRAAMGAYGTYTIAAPLVRALMAPNPTYAPERQQFRQQHKAMLPAQPHVEPAHPTTNFADMLRRPQPIGWQSEALERQKKRGQR